MAIGQSRDLKLPAILKNGGETTTTSDNMPEDVGDEGMAEGVDTIARHTFTVYHRKATSSKVRTVVPSA